MKLPQLWLGLLPFLLISCASLGEPEYIKVDGIGIFRPGQASDKKLLNRLSSGFREAGGAYSGSDPYFPIVLRAYRGEPRDLANFLRVSYRSSRSAAGSAMNDSITVSLLYHWGDDQFAEVLSSQSDEVRLGIGEHLWRSTNAAFRKSFPATFKSVSLPTSKRSRN